jgi:uncharacterized protein (DUF924 family)
MTTKDTVAKRLELVQEHLEMIANEFESIISAEGRLPGRYSALARTAVEEAVNWMDRSTAASEGYEQPGGES